MNEIGTVQAGYTLAELSRLWRVPIWTLEDCVANGLLPRTDVGGRLAVSMETKREWERRLKPPSNRRA